MGCYLSDVLSLDRSLLASSLRQREDAEVMKRAFFSLALGLMVGSGCANSYVIKLNNGLRLTSATKPKLKNGHYVYTDASGKTASVPAGRVREIEPASMANEEEKKLFKPATSK